MIILPIVMSFILMELLDLDAWIDTQEAEERINKWCRQNAQGAKLMDWRDNKKLHNIRLNSLKKALTSRLEFVILDDDKKLTRHILRGFSNDQIYDFAQELYYYWDHPTYWQSRTQGALANGA